MIEQQHPLWTSGVTGAPLPPVVDVPADQDEQQALVSLYRHYGPVFRIAQPDGSFQVILAGPEANVFMARHEDELFSTREQWEQFDKTMARERSQMNASRDGEANRKRRAASSRQWSRARILDQIPQMTAITQQCIQNWHTGSRVAVHASMRRLVAEQLGRLLLGYGPEDYLDDFVVYLNTTIVNTLRVGQKGTLDFDSEAYKCAAARVFEFGHKVYQAHLTNPQPNGKPDMMDDAIAQSAEYPAEYREAIMARVALGPMLAGIDTVANSLSFMIYALLANPEVLQRVQAEVDAAFAQGELTWDRLRQMPDLQGTMMETLRRYPVASGHRARVVQPFAYAGCQLETGNNVTVAMTVPHFLEELYPDPLRFDIERFRGTRNEHRQRGAYAPFGLGDHTCLGAGIAEVQMMATMAVLLHHCRFQFDPPSYQLVIESHPTPVPGNNFHVKIVERQA